MNPCACRSVFSRQRFIQQRSQNSLTASVINLPGSTLKVRSSSQSLYLSTANGVTDSFLLGSAGKDSVPESVHHVVVELDPESSESKAMLAIEEAKLVTTDDVHPNLPSDKNEKGSELIKR